MNIKLKLYLIPSASKKELGKFGTVYSIYVRRSKGDNLFFSKPRSNFPLLWFPVNLVFLSPPVEDPITAI